MHDHIAFQLQHLDKLIKHTYFAIEKEIQTIAKTPRHVAYLRKENNQQKLVRHGSQKLLSLRLQMEEYAKNAESYKHDDQMLHDALIQDSTQNIMNTIFNIGMMFASKHIENTLDEQPLCRIS